MAAGKSSRINRQYKTKYRIRNWREYERGLRSCGDVTIWLSEDAIAAWIPPEERSPRRAASILEPRDPDRVDAAGRLRPTASPDGGVPGLAAQLDEPRPQGPGPHTTLSRRNQIVVVPPLTRAHDGPIDLIVDSTGLKSLGRGEWNAHKHKTSKKRRDWRGLRPQIGPRSGQRGRYRERRDCDPPSRAYRSQVGSLRQEAIRWPTTHSTTDCGLGSAHGSGES